MSDPGLISDIPDDLVMPPVLPDGTALSDVNEEELVGRFQALTFFMTVLVMQLERFVDRDYAEEDDFLAKVTPDLDYFERAFRGAREWLQPQEHLMLQTFDTRGEQLPEAQMPAAVRAVMWCCVACETEDTFWATVRAQQGKWQTAKHWRKGKPALRAL